MKKQLLGVFAAAGLALGSLGVVGCGTNDFPAHEHKLPAQLISGADQSNYDFYWDCAISPNNETIRLAFFDDHSCLIFEGGELNPLSGWLEISSTSLEFDLDGGKIKMTEIAIDNNGSHLSAKFADDATYPVACNKKLGKL